MKQESDPNCTPCHTAGPQLALKKGGARFINVEVRNLKMVSNIKLMYNQFPGE